MPGTTILSPDVFTSWNFPKKTPLIARIQALFLLKSLPNQWLRQKEWCIAVGLLKSYHSSSSVFKTPFLRSAPIRPGQLFSLPLLFSPYLWFSPARIRQRAIFFHNHQNRKLPLLSYRWALLLRFCFFSPSLCRYGRSTREYKRLIQWVGCRTYL